MSSESELVTPRGAFPHLREANGFVFVSGTSSRRPDNSFVGVEVDEMGTTSLDISAQTTAVLTNIESILKTVGLDRSDLIDATVFLVNMNDFGGYNTAWKEFFAADGHRDLIPPARTTVAVHQLPHPHLLIEIKATAVARDTATAVARDTATAVARDTATAVARDTATAVARDTARIEES